MALEVINIHQTGKTPGVILRPEGFVRIDGRGFNELNFGNSEKILEWIREYLKNPADITEVIISLEYLNSASAKTIHLILKEISQVTSIGKIFAVHWCYEEDDEDILERGEYISETLNIPIDFIRTRNIKYCCKSIC